MIVMHGPKPGRLSSGRTVTSVCGSVPPRYSSPLKKYPIFMSVPFGNGCVGTSIVGRKMAGTPYAHHSTAPLNRMCSSSATQTMSRRVAVCSNERWPVAGAGLSCSVDRVLVWQGMTPGVRSGEGVLSSMSSISVGLETSDAQIIIFLPKKGTPNRS